MKIFTKSYLLLIALTLSFFSGMSTAADIEAGVVKKVQKDENLPEIAGDRLSISGVSEKVENISSEFSTKAAASGISYYEIYAVGSSNVGWEYPSALQGSTTYNHGGSQLSIAVIQYGYGNPNQATMNGISNSYSSSSVLCGTLATLHYCSAGETVTGWLYMFNFNGQQSGNFVTSSNSTASPFGYWSDSIYIQ